MSAAGKRPGSQPKGQAMYLTFPNKYTVHIHDDKTGQVVNCNSVPEPIESGQFTGPDQFVIYTKKRIFVFQRVGNSRSFTQAQVRLNTI